MGSTSSAATASPATPSRPFSASCAGTSGTRDGRSGHRVACRNCGRTWRSRPSGSRTTWADHPRRETFPTPSGVAPADVRNALAAGRAYSADSVDAACEGGPDGPALVYVLPDAEPGYDLVETRACLRGALDSLSERERRILGLRYYAQLTQSEIAAELGISQMHVSRLLRRSLDSLRERLSPTGSARAGAGPPTRGRPARDTGRLRTVRTGRSTSGTTRSVGVDTWTGRSQGHSVPIPRPTSCREPKTLDRCEFRLSG